MTGRFVLSPRAEIDLDEIWDYTAERWGLEQAETYTRAIWERIKAISRRPAMGQDASDIRANYYKVPCGSHFLFYRLITEGVDVVRILHERMDYDSHLP